MQRFFFFIGCCLFLSQAVYAQKKPAVKSKPNNTYAVVVGISSYSSEIVRLDFAHRDAEEFARFLRSDAGGNVPQENIRLLLNGEATYTAVYNALYWLLETCEQNDKVYFYFSGHGDVENSTIYKLGFLLAANTPRFNYINNAIRVEDLNIIANSISTEKKARVILITDACRSGKLAGSDNRGNFLVGEQLRAARGNEIRITSCGPDELSNEDPGWAGGRGVFSYYLVKGLEGMADASGDMIVTLREIKAYMKEALANDKILKEKEHPQNPVINGVDSLVLTRIVPAPAKSVQTRDLAEESQMMPTTVPAPLGVSPQGYVLGLAKGKKIEEVFDFNVLEKLGPDQIPFVCVDMLTRSGGKIDDLDTLKVARLVSSLKNNKDALARFREKLVELMADRGQEIINLYLEGDEAEMEKRRYYNSMSNQYAVYPRMFAVALKLVEPQNRLYQILKVKLHYFSGVTLRLKMPLVKNHSGLLDSAFREQMAALKLEENAAYIYNELGILYRLKKDNASSEKNYIRATQLAPTWALPLSNLAALYSSTGRYEKGLEAIQSAMHLQPDLQTAFTNAGLLYERKGNYLLAEEHYRKSIRMNSRHYLPFERMGYVLMNTTAYARADSSFIEAEKRKRGFNFPLADSDGDGVTDMFDVLPPFPDCPFDTSLVKKGDVIGHFFIGLKYLSNQQPEKAEQKFKQVIQMDRTNPLAYQQLGQLMYRQNRWKEGELMLRFALQYHLDTVRFAAYCDSLIQLFPQYGPSAATLPVKQSGICAYDQFLYSWVPKTTSRYFLAALYEHWQHYGEAEEQYRQNIKEDPYQLAAYIKCMTLLEKNGRFHDAEQIIRKYPMEQTVENELAALYYRITKNNPERAEWFYKAGSLMHEMVLRSPKNYEDDRMTFLPDSDVPVYLDKVRPEGQKEFVKEVPGTGESYLQYTEVLFPKTEGIGYLKTAARLIPEWSVVKTDPASETIIDHVPQLAEIAFKTGDLLVWQGLPQLAEAYYSKAMRLMPDDAGTKIKYVQSGISNYNYAAVLEVLDTLYKKNQISFETQLLMAGFCIHAGRFADSRKLLAEAASIHPFPVPAITDLNGRLELLANKPLQAIPYYKNWLALHPNNGEAMYTLARLYAKSGNSTEAWKWLSESLKAGFNYYWVLQYDESWETYRVNRKWKVLTGHLQPVFN